MREIITKDSQVEKELTFFFYDEDGIVDDIVSILAYGEEYEYIPNDVRWRVALYIRLYVENGGDLAKLVKEVQLKEKRS